MGYLYGDSVQTSFSHTATYTYDKVNRLLTAVATPFGTGTVSYNLTFNYKTPDNSNGQYGNMSCVVNGQTVGLCNNLSFNTAHNQITTYSYDAAGNVTNSTAHTYQWDAEERVSVVDPGSSPTWTFTYNALGHRVQWVGRSSTDQHLFDPAGNWLGNAGQYSLVRFGDRHILVSTATGTNFNHINAIGSTSIMTNQVGGPAEDMLFYPWGDAWLSAGGGGYNFAYLPYRDINTSSDFATARIYGDDFGRWFTPDPAGKGAVKLDDPQTWNMYAYVRNNPTTLTDPTGLEERKDPCAEGNSECEANWRKSGKGQTVVFSDRANAEPTQPGGTGAAAERIVDYQAGKMDKNGHIDSHDIERDAKLTLHEKLDPNSKSKATIESEPHTETGIYKDTQFVPAGGSFRVLRDWNVDGNPASVLDLTTHKAFQFEVITFDAFGNPPIRTDYTNTPPF
jgi:RHS repeat-associated protein